MNFRRSVFVIVVLLVMSLPAYAGSSECVVLLHGLARTSASMQDLERYLANQGYRVLNIDYPSRKYPVADLADLVGKEVAAKTAHAEKVHFITHSLGGIIVRHMQKTNPLPNLGRVVMLGPPNSGSEVVDKLGNLRLFEWINGPAGKQLSTSKDGVAQTLGKVNFELGVIAGDRSINRINSLMIPGNDDGKVSVESTKVEGMADFRVVPVSHPFLMKDKMVMAQCLYFLQNGRFAK